MRTPRHLLFVLVLMAVALTATAQKRGASSTTDTKAAITAMDSIIARYPAHIVEPVVAEICGKNKNNPEMCVGAAEAFWYKTGIRDSTNAFKYIKKALSANRNYVPAYVLTAEIWRDCNDTLKAYEWYDKAIEANPQYAKTYRSLARMKEKNGDIEGACKIFELAKTAIPTFPANLEMARMLQKQTTGRELNLALKYFQEAEKDSMEAYDYNRYAGLYNALAASVSDKGDKASYFSTMLKISEEGIQRFPDDFYVLQAGLVSSVNLHSLLGNSELENKRQLAEKAENYGKHIMEVGDTLITDACYRFYGFALKYRNKYDKAIEMFENVLDSKTAPESDKISALNQIADSYKELGEYDKAEALFKKRLAAKEADGTVRFDDYAAIANLYEQQAEELNGMERIEALKKADAMYGRAAEKDLQNADRAYYNQILTRNQIDEDMNDGLALEPARRLYSLMLTRGTLEGNDRIFMKYASQYIAIYYFKIKDLRKIAKPYFVKWHDVDPTNTNVINVLTKVYKMKL